MTSYPKPHCDLAAAVDRDRSKPMAVLMAMEDFACYEETRHLLRSAANADRLLSSIAELENEGGLEGFRRQ